MVLSSFLTSGSINFVFPRFLKMHIPACMYLTADVAITVCTLAMILIAMYAAAVAITVCTLAMILITMYVLH